MRENPDANITWNYHFHAKKPSGHSQGLPDPYSPACAISFIRRIPARHVRHVIMHACAKRKQRGSNRNYTGEDNSELRDPSLEKHRIHAVTHTPCRNNRVYN